MAEHPVDPRPKGLFRTGCRRQRAYIVGADFILMAMQERMPEDPPPSDARVYVITADGTRYNVARGIEDPYPGEVSIAAAWDEEEEWRDEGSDRIEEGD